MKYEEMTKRGRVAYVLVGRCQCVEVKGKFDSEAIGGGGTCC